jgi:hypothetical protein
MQEDQRDARTSFNVVEPNAILLEELTGGRIILLRLLRKMTVDKCSRR